MNPSPSLSFTYARYTSCSGCQLMLLNMERDLDVLAGLIRIESFNLASSRQTSVSEIDLAMVEGSVSTTRELLHLLALRRSAKILVAIGLCALTGGVNALANTDRGVAIAEVYGTDAVLPDTFHPQPLHHFVRVDASVTGCPPERHDLANLIGALLRGGRPGRQEMPVCMECRTAEYRCLLMENKTPCFGPVTQGGCKARCPGIGVGCEGCRGTVAEANRVEMVHLLMELGLSEKEVARRLHRFGKEAHD